MKRISKKRVYTYYRINLRFKNEDAEDKQLLKKFKSEKAKSALLKNLLINYLQSK